MKTKTFNGVRIKNTEFAMGELLFDMDVQTAIEYKERCKMDRKIFLRDNDRRNAKVVAGIVNNIDNYITALS
jgi:hypothetical protein